MTRAFFRALQEAEVQSKEGGEKLRRVLQLCLDQGDAIEFNLQEHSEVPKEEAGNLEAESEAYVVCVGLTPHRSLKGGGGGGRPSRPDAVIRISLREPSDNRERKIDEVVIAVETKLRRDASWDQVRSHGTHLKHSGPDVVVALPWQRLYRELSNRPDYLDHDALIADFDEFIVRFPRLTGWTGISAGDIDAATRPRRTKLKVEQLAHRLMEELGEAKYQPLERQRGGGDFTIRPTGPGGSAGNLGVATWPWCAGELCLKLVVGSKSKKETDAWLRLRDGIKLEAVAEAFEQFLAALTSEFPSAQAELKGKYRFFKYPQTRTFVFDRWKLTGDDAVAPLSALRDMLDAVSDIHSKSGSLTTRDFLRAQRIVEESARAKFQKQLNNALSDEKEAAKWYQFGKFNFMSLVPEEDLVDYDPDQQVEQLSQLVEIQRRILQTVVS